MNEFLKKNLRSSKIIINFVKQKKQVTKQKTKQTKQMQELTKVQTLLKVNKNEYNSFGKYKYRTAEAIMHEVKPHLITFNLSLYFNDKTININDLIVIKSIAILKNNETLEKIYGVGYAGVDLQTKGMHVAQCFGASTSYARKYALQGLFLLDDASDDIDSKDNTKFNNTKFNNTTKMANNKIDTATNNEIANNKIDSDTDNKIANGIINKSIFTENKSIFTEKNFMKAYQSHATFDEIRKYYILTEQMKQKYLIFISQQESQPLKPFGEKLDVQEESR